jgi:hypothetical protein
MEVVNLPFVGVRDRCGRFSLTCQIEAKCEIESGVFRSQCKYQCFSRVLHAWIRGTVFVKGAARLVSVNRWTGPPHWVS